MTVVKFARIFSMVWVFPVPGGPSIMDMECVRAFSTAAFWLRLKRKGKMISSSGASVLFIGLRFQISGERAFRMNEVKLGVYFRQKATAIPGFMRIGHRRFGSSGNGAQIIKYLLSLRRQIGGFGYRKLALWRAEILTVFF